MSSDKLVFYSKSRDVAPGKGANESVRDVAAYAELSRIKNWRKVLSNFHEAAFMFRGHTYKTIEHAFQAAKIALVDEAAAYRFTTDSGDPLGHGDGLTARKNRKLVVLNSTDLQTWDAMSASVMHEIARAKYDQCAEARIVLGATKDAELWHVVPRGKPVRFVHLEAIRSFM